MSLLDLLGRLKSSEKSMEESGSQSARAHTSTPTEKVSLSASQSAREHPFGLTDDSDVKMLDPKVDDSVASTTDLTNRNTPETPATFSPPRSKLGESVASTTDLGLMTHIQETPGSALSNFSPLALLPRRCESVPPYSVDSERLGLVGALTPPKEPEEEMGRALWRYRPVGRLGGEAWDLRQQHIFDKEAQVMEEQQAEELERAKQHAAIQLRLEKHAVCREKKEREKIIHDDRLHVDLAVRIQEREEQKRKEKAVEERAIAQKIDKQHMEAEQRAKEKEVIRLLAQGKREVRIRDRIEAREKERHQLWLIEEQHRARRIQSEQLKREEEAKKVEELKIRQRQQREVIWLQQKNAAMQRKIQLQKEQMQQDAQAHQTLASCIWQELEDVQVSEKKLTASLQHVKQVEQREKKDTRILKERQRDVERQLDVRKQGALQAFEAKTKSAVDKQEQLYQEKQKARRDKVNERVAHFQDLRWERDEMRRAKDAAGPQIPCLNRSASDHLPLRTVKMLTGGFVDPMVESCTPRGRYSTLPLRMR